MDRNDIPTEFDNEIFEQLADVFVGEEILCELPAHPLRCSDLDFSVESLHAVDEYLRAVHDNPASEEDMFKIVLRAGSYVGEVLRRSDPHAGNWVQYDRASDAIDQMTNGLGHHPGTLAVLMSDTAGTIFPLGKVFKFLTEGPGDSTHFFAVAMLEKWSLL